MKKLLHAVRDLILGSLLFGGMYVVFYYLATIAYVH